MTLGPTGLSPQHQKLLRTLPAPGAAAAGSLRVCSTAPWWSRLGRGPVSSPTGLYPARSKAAAFRAIQVDGQREPRKPISGIVEPKTSLPLAPQHHLLAAARAVTVEAQRAAR